MITPAIALAIAAFIVGHPTQVMCNAPEGPQSLVMGYTVSGVVHIRPSLCSAVAGKPGPEMFALGISALIHESAHARGISKEACAELIADLGVYQVLRDFYGIPFFTPLSWAVGRQVYANTLTLPAKYQTAGATCP
jgi:hypothetical protein